MFWNFKIISLHVVSSISENSIYEVKKGQNNNLYVLNLVTVLIIIFYLFYTENKYGLFGFVVYFDGKKN